LQIDIVKGRPYGGLLNIAKLTKINIFSILYSKIAVKE